MLSVYYFTLWKITDNLINLIFGSIIMGKKVKEFKVIIKDDRIALIDSNGNNLFESLSNAEKTQSTYHVIWKITLMAMASLGMLAFFTSINPFFTIGGAVVSGFATLIFWLCAGDEETTIKNVKRDINLAHEQLEDAILQAKIRLINQKKSLAQSLAEDKLDFKFHQSKGKTLEEQILEVEYEK